LAHFLFGHPRASVVKCSLLEMGLAMCRASFPAVIRQADFSRSLVRCACTLAVLLAAVAVFAQSDASTTDPLPSAEVQTYQIAYHPDAKKIEKYDVTRIGHRGIGHGFNMYSLNRERQLGMSLAAAFDQYTKLVHDQVLNDYVNRLAQKIVRNSDAEIPFTIRVMDAGDIPRAYGLPGGFLYVDSALILASDSESELAAMLAREIAHVAARHATRAMTRKNLFSMTGSLSMLAGPVGMLLQDAGGVAGPLSVKKFSRDSEFEADLLGIEYAYSAGYDPQSMLDALEKLHAIEAGRTSVFGKVPGSNLASKIPFHHKLARGFSDYPLMDDRINRLQSEIAAFLPARSDYILDTDEFQQIKSRLLSLQTPLQLRRHSEDENPKAPVLRRMPDTEGETGANTGNLVTTFR